MPRSISDYVDPALEALNAGFASVAAQKRALDNVSRAFDLSEIFGGLMVSVNTHVVHGHKGAVFYRSFYYLAGEFTPLNIIIAAAEELARRAEAA